MAWYIKKEREWFDEHFEIVDGQAVCKTIVWERPDVSEIKHPIINPRDPKREQLGMITVRHLLCRTCLSESEVRHRLEEVPVGMDELDWAYQVDRQ
jgi:hypothetical protein